MWRIISFFLTSCMMILTFSCLKEKSLENQNITTAQGSLQSDINDDCLPKTIAGIYEAGTALSPANFISIDIDVTTTGTYSIISDAVNGYSFKGIGTFTSTGVQTVNLSATGKPLAAGTDDFVISFDGSICLVQVTVLPNGSGGPAAFTLQGAGGSCTNATINGSYFAGIPLNASNTVTLTVNVTEIGSYSITTTAVNGITFSGSGVFSATGVKNVTLTGSGIPANNSAATITVAAGGGNCTFIVPVSAPAAMTIDCNSALVAGTYVAGTALSSGNTVSIRVSVIIAGSYAINTSPVNGMVFSGSGTLAAGGQIMTLTGSGIPTTTGNFTITVTFGTSTCTFPLTVSGLAATEWTFTQGATTTYQGFTDTAKMNVLANINTFSYTGSNATDDIVLVLTDFAGGIQDNEVYNTSSIASNSASFLFVGASETYAANNTFGNVNLVFKVTTHNTATKTIQGTFFGTVLDTNSAIKNITNGQFRGTYQ